MRLDYVPINLTKANGDSAVAWRIKKLTGCARGAASVAASRRQRRDLV